MSDIIIHVGYGKTGTTAIQGWLLRNRDVLAGQGILDCGTALQNPALGNPEDLRVPQLLQKIRSNPEVLADKFAKQLNTVAKDYSTLVWSSEFLLTHRSFVDRLVQKIDRAHTVKVVVYLRNHVDWLMSAYAQWAIKHKQASVDGGVVSFDSFVAQRVHDLDFVSMLSDWDAIENSKLVALSYDAVDDVVSSFSSVLGIDPKGFKTSAKGVNQNLGRAQLSLLKLMQQNTEEAIDYRKLAALLANAGADGRDIRPVDPTPIPVGAARLSELHNGFEQQRRLLKNRFGVKLSEDFKPNRNAHVDGTDETNTDLISILGLLCYNLSQRTVALERKVGVLMAEKSQIRQ